MRYLYSFLVVAAAALAGCHSQGDDLDFVYPTLPEIPSNHVVIADFGAKADGQTLCTEAFVRALAHLDSLGGGTLEVGAGEWLTGPIVLGSHVELHLAEGAVLRFDPSLALYATQDALWGNGVKRHQAPITAYRQTDVAITGSGIIDGGGEAWRPKKRELHTPEEWAALVADTEAGVADTVAGRWFPIAPDEREYCQTHEVVHRGRVQPWHLYKSHMRPENIYLYECQRVLLEGVTFRNSPFWNVHPELCSDVTVKGVTIYNDWNAVNGDGLDLESCSRVWVTGCRFDVGDDAVCLKSGMNAAGRLRGRPTEDVLVEDCYVQHAHGGFVVGSEMSGGVRNVHIRRCTFEGTESGLRFKTNRQRGGQVRNIVAEDITMSHIVSDALLFDMYYRGQTPSLEYFSGNSIIDTVRVAVNDSTPSFSGIHFARIHCTDVGRTFYFDGLREMPISDISIRQLSSQAHHPSLFSECRDIQLDDIEIRQGGCDTIYLYHTEGLNASPAIQQMCVEL